MSDRNLNLTPESSSDPGGEPQTVACPTCKSPVAEAAVTFPFCSPRCKTIDLGRWFDESYKVSRPIEQSDIEEGD